MLKNENWCVIIIEFHGEVFYKILVAAVRPPSVNSILSIIYLHLFIIVFIIKILNAKYSTSPKFTKTASKRVSKCRE
jgi:hypothetical protein